MCSKLKKNYNWRKSSYFCLSIVSKIEKKWKTFSLWQLLFFYLFSLSCRMTNGSIPTGLGRVVTRFCFVGPCCCCCCCCWPGCGCPGPPGLIPVGAAFGGTCCCCCCCCCCWGSGFPPGAAFYTNTSTQQRQKKTLFYFL